MCRFDDFAARRWHTVCRVQRIPPCLGLLLLLPACSSHKGFESSEVSRSDYGTVWPLTVDGGVIACEPRNVATFTVNGRSYGLERLSTGADVPAGFRRIWAHDPVTGARKDLSPLLDDSLALCG
jgi:hypothetical protein